MSQHFINIRADHRKYELGYFLLLPSVCGILTKRVKRQKNLFFKTLKEIEIALQYILHQCRYGNS